MANVQLRKFRPGPEAYELFLRSQTHLKISVRAQAGVQPAEERHAAAAFFRQAIELEPRYADAYGTLAQVLCDSNSKAYESDQVVRESEENAQTALRYDARNLAARVALICVAHVRGRQNDALRIALEVQRIGQSSAGASFAAGEAFFRAGLVQHALPFLKDAVGKSPDLIAYRQELAYALMLAGRPAECVEVLSPLLKKEQGGYWHATNCLKEVGRYQEAIAYGEKYVSLQPEAPTAYRALALAYRMAGREAEAKAVLTKAVRYFEGVAETGGNLRNASFLAVMNAHLRNAEAARRWAQAALQPDPNNSWMLYNVAVAHGILGDDDVAMDCLERAFANGFALKYYLDWQVRPDMDVPTLRNTERFQELGKKLQRRLSNIEASLRH